MIVDSERLDLPSASSAGRRRRCVGSENLIRELRAHNLLAEIPQDPDALFGTLVHRAWAGEKVDLNGNQATTLEDLQRLETMLVADWSGDEPVYLIGREQRLWLHYGLEPKLSGQYDVGYGKNGGRDVLLLDAKTLYGEVDPAELNDQLRELVALWYFNHPRVERIRVAILAPKQRERCTVADYDRPEMELAYRLMRNSLADAADPNAPRTPGSHCRTCPARLNCEEVRSLIGSTYKLAKRIEDGEFQIPTGDKGARYLDSVKTAQKVLDALEKRYKALLEQEPDSLPGWRLKEGKKIRIIAQVDKAFEAAMSASLRDTDFWSCCELRITQLSAKLGEVTGTKGKGLERKFLLAFGDLVTYRQNRPELEKIGRKSGQLDLEDEPERLVNSD